MTDKDERIINRALAEVDYRTSLTEEELQDLREEARAALHRLFRDRRRLEQNQCLICENPADHDACACVTEVERLRNGDWAEDLDERRRAAEAEVESWKHIATENYRQWQKADAAEAELERLRALYDSEVAQHNRDILEVERLRDDINTHEYAANEAAHRNAKLAAEVERLRAERDEFNDLYDEAEAEVERLREDRDTLTEVVNEMKDEEERLQAGPLYDEWRKAVAEVERLRQITYQVTDLKAENERLGDMASFYGQGMDKAVARLRRIEEAARACVIEGEPRWDALRAALEEEA